MRRRPWLFALVVLLSAPRAAAEPAPIEARYDRAFARRAEGKDAEALAILESIEAEAPSGRSAAQVALAEQALGRWLDAERHLVLALERGGPWVAARRPLLDRSLTTIRSHLGDLELDIAADDGDAPTVEVYVDGHRVDAAAPRTLRLPAGDVAVEVRAEGYESVRRTVPIVGGRLAREPIALARRTTPVVVPVVVPVVAPRIEPNTPAPVPASPPRSSALTTLGWIGVGTGGAALLASGVMALSARSTFTSARDRCGAFGCPPAAVDDAERAFDIATGATITFTAGLTVVVVGAALLLLAPKAPSRVAGSAEGAAVRW